MGEMIILTELATETEGRDWENCVYWAVFNFKNRLYEVLPDTFVVKWFEWKFPSAVTLKLNNS